MQIDREAAAVLSAAVDWLTCSATAGARGDLLRAVGWEVVYAEAQAGNDLRPYAWRGYVGYASGQASVGERGDGVLCRFSGTAAAGAWLRAVRCANRVSRVDLAVTVRLGSDVNPAADVFHGFSVLPEGRRGRRITKASHIETWTEGETTYLGSRHSDRFGRIYDKGRESGKEELRGAWRWEVEFKGNVSTPVATALAEEGGTPAAVLGLVHDTFAGFGAPPSWGRGAVVLPHSAARERTDDDRRLAWLATQVAPVIVGLNSRGRGAEALRALGLEGRVL